MKFIVLGTSEFTLRCGQALLDSGEEICTLISIPGHIRPDNSADVAGFAKKRSIPYHETGNINSSESLRLMRENSPDYIFSSWPKILKKEALDVPRFCCIGSHPTNLPYNRGRHPLHWLIALGISETKLSLFRMDEGVDTGNLLLQIPFDIAPDDLIGDVVTKMNAAAYDGVIALCKKLHDDPFYIGVPQDHTLTNYWRKRTPYDITLDLRMSAETIIRTVRSYTLPYPCANLVFEGQIVKIVKASLAPVKMTDTGIRRIEHGKILKADKNIIWVKADDDIVELECLGNIPPELAEAEYIYPPIRYVMNQYRSSHILLKHFC